MTSGSDLGPNYLQWLSEDDTSRQKIKNDLSLIINVLVNNQVFSHIGRMENSVNPDQLASSEAS